MNGVAKDLITEIAIALNATDTPLVKDEISYRILVFKENVRENWVLSMLPDIIMVEELFIVLNESYDSFLKGVDTPNGIIFLCASEPNLLVKLAKEWYYN